MPRCLAAFLQDSIESASASALPAFGGGSSKRNSDFLFTSFEEKAKDPAKDKKSSAVSEPEPGDWFKDPDKFSPWTWRKQHNYFLDRGSKFMVVYKTPTLVSTDLFDLERFGCFQVRGYQGGSGMDYFANAAAGAMGVKVEKVKKWWMHPRIEFAAPVSRIGVRLQDMTTGELRWDAIYDLGKASWKRRSSQEETACPEDGWHLCEDEEPVGGEHPFFQPDWCPGPNDGMSHKYQLTISNLSQRDSPEQPLVGEMIFTQYGVNQLDNTYSFEMHAPLSEKDQNRFNEIEGMRKKDAMSRATGRAGSPETVAQEASRGKMPNKMDKMKKLKDKDPTKAQKKMKDKMNGSAYKKMLDNKDVVKAM